MPYRVLVIPKDLWDPLEIQIQNPLGDVLEKTGSYLRAIDWLIEHGVSAERADYVRQQQPNTVYWYEDERDPGGEDIPA